MNKQPSLAGKRCVLLPGTKRLKQVITEHGDTWRIEAGPVPMACFENQAGLRIKSENGAHIRNVLTADVEVQS